MTSCVRAVPRDKDSAQKGGRRDSHSRDSINESLTGPGSFLEPARPASEVNAMGGDETGRGQTALWNRVLSSREESHLPSYSENSMET